MFNPQRLPLEIFLLPSELATVIRLGWTVSGPQRTANASRPFFAAELPSKWAVVRHGDQELLVLDGRGRRRAVLAVEEPHEGLLTIQRLETRYSCLTVTAPLFPPFVPASRDDRRVVVSVYVADTARFCLHRDYFVHHVFRLVPADVAVDPARLAETVRAAEAEVETWLDERFPAWRDPVAYWDD